MKQDFICPYPMRWNQIYKDLGEAYESSTGKKLPLTSLDVWWVGGPPTPLILGGWVFSNDDDKRERWKETLLWAEKHNLLHLTNVEDSEKCFFCGHTRSGGIRGEFCEYNKKIMYEYKLSKYVTLNQYLSDPVSVKSGLPDSKGVYFVIYPYEWPDDLFLSNGTGGHFKGRDPNVPLEKLWGNWVEDADILYIGQAGGISKNGKPSEATLQSRIIQLLKFGNGENVGHWGGRYLWQHEYSPDFRVYWYVCVDENPVTLEKELIAEFEKTYGKKPFANLR